MNQTFIRLFAAALTVSACTSPSTQVEGTVTAQDPAGTGRLPTGVRLDPAGVSHELGSMPLAMVLSPQKDRIVVLLNGWREQGIQVVERSSGRVLQPFHSPRFSWDSHSVRTDNLCTCQAAIRMSFTALTGATAQPLSLTASCWR